MGLALGMVGGVWEVGGGVGGGMSGYEEVAAEKERERQIEIMRPKMLALHMYKGNRSDNLAHQHSPLEMHYCQVHSTNSQHIL